MINAVAVACAVIAALGCSEFEADITSVKDAKILLCEDRAIVAVLTDAIYSYEDRQAVLAKVKERAENSCGVPAEVTADMLVYTALMRMFMRGVNADDLQCVSKRLDRARQGG